ncbi:FUSC family protein [Actinacidiphila sp. ITFR-21]|uniref:FUSC family protein n=1 Tax=Actinacidiphila sp. ITFR-21 TaxID=3075199 RepID=UPI0028895B3B|nr:FUSC family protein [Streptomyces sp. ITFR-21]WNI16474.1 FUSC family protein [Streptomyces sp. ITFR-21]
MAMAATGWISETWDRVVGSDPGLQRFRTASSAGLAMATTLGLEYGYGRLTDRGPQGTMVAMMLGTVMAMMGSMALTDGSAAWPKIRTALFFPVAIGAGMLVGVAVAGHTDWMLAVFVAVMFVAVFIRRFGPAFFFYGFMIWMGYFFAAFLNARINQLPALLGAVCLAVVWVLLLATTLLRTNPQRTLARVRRAFNARARSVARACADLLAADPCDVRRQARLRRTLHSRQLRLAETALVIEGWSAAPGALPPGMPAAAVRRRALDVHLAIDAMATAVEGMAGTDARHMAEAARIAGYLAGSDYPAAEREARALLAGEADHQDLDAEFASWADGGPSSPTAAAAGSSAPDGGGIRDIDCLAHHLATAAWEFAVLARRAGTYADPGTADGDGERDEEDFEPAVRLALGLLPGSAAVVAGGVPARSRWNPAGGLSFTTRQAVQVAVAGALAILAGRELSQARYYWAVLAAFIAFTGTATRSETFIKAANRVAGTLVGLGAGIGLAHLTAGHTYWILAVVVLSMTCGFYLVTVSYAAMIFFVTIMVSQLYSELHVFSASLLMLRLEETAIGAAIGIVVALVVLPTSTRDTVNSARSSYYAALAELLRACAVRLERGAEESAGGGAAGSGGGEAGRADGGPVAGRAAGGADLGGGVPPGSAAAAGGAGSDLAGLIRVVDHRLQQLALVARPLTRPLVWGNDPRLVRHRLTLYAAATRQIRALALGPRRAPGLAGAPHLAAASRSLADAATALALSPAPQSRPAPEVDRALRAADAALLTRLPDPGTLLPPVTRPLLRLRQLLRELAVQTPTDRPAPSAPSRVVTSGGGPPAPAEPAADPARWRG